MRFFQLHTIVCVVEYTGGSLEVNADYIQQIEDLCFPEKMELEVENTLSDYEKLSQIFGLLQNQTKRATKTDIIEILKK